jgi:hypothetical protein
MHRSTSRYAPSLTVTLAICLLVSAIVTRGASAQSIATLNGTVKDSSGAFIARAQVTLTNPSTGVAQTKETNETGLYSFMNVLPGSYTLLVTREGFTPELQPRFTLEVNQTATVNFVMQVGLTRTEVQVSAQAIQLETSTAELGSVIGTREVLNLPLNGRNFSELLLLTPGASPANPLQNAGGAPGSIGTFSFPAIDGQSNRSNMFLLDGVNNYGAGGDTYTVQPTIDDVLEFKVQSHNDEAQFGQVLGGIVNLATKAGTNSYHGSGWEFARSSALDANNFFNPETALTQNQFGGSVGGPVLLPHYNGRNKTFFYASYEGYRQTTSSQLLYLTPTPAQLAGDFSAVGSQIYNPYSSQPDPNNPGSFINSPFMCDASGNPLPANPNGTQSPGTSCNKIPASLLNQTMVTYAKTIFPAPKTLSNPNFNGQDTDPIHTSSNQMSVRFDQQLGGNDRFFVRYTGAWQTNTSPIIQGNMNDNTVKNYNLGVSFAHTFKGDAVSRFTFGRVHGVQATVPKFTIPVKENFLQGQFALNFVNHSPTPLFPTVTINGYLGDGNYLAGGTYSNIYEFKSDTSKVIGRHLVQFGASLATNNTVGYTTGSSDVFDVLQTSSGSSVMGGDAMASTLLGLPTYAEVDNVYAGLRGGKIFGGYVEDQWKVNDRLTLNLGLRYDVTDWPSEGVPSNHSNITGNLDLNTGTYVLQIPAPACSATQGAPCIPGGTLPDHVTVSKSGKLIGNTYDNIQPRLGVAYRIGSRTVFRAAYGRYFDNWAAVIRNGASFTQSWPNVAFLAGNNLNSPFATVTASDPLLIGSGPLTPAPTPFIQSNGFIDPHMPTPLSNQFNVGFQREWADNSVLTVNYVGSRNSREQLQLTGNAAPTPGPGDPQQRAPYPYIPAQNSYVQDIGKSNYNALQVSAQGRSGNGLTYNLNYTWSKVINYGCDNYSGVCDVQDPYHWQKDKGVAGFDLTHIFAGSLVYELPFGPGKRWRTENRVVNYLIGGWQLNSILSLGSGTPYDVQAPYQIANTNNISGVERANVVGNPHLGVTRLNPINIAAFQIPAPYTFGNMGRNSLRSDWRRNWDASLFRSFPMTERTRIELRLEAFNVTNTPVFSAPDFVVTDPNFGQVSSTANTQRQLQVAAKFYF